MKAVRFNRPRANFRRILRPHDLEALGISSKETLVWNPENNFTIVMNNKLSESLVGKLPGEFTMSDTEGDDEDPEVLDPMTSLAQSGSGHPEGSADESKDDPDDDDDESIDADDPDA